MTPESGKRYGRITAHVIGAGIMSAKCDCGFMFTVEQECLTSGRETSCGCENKPVKEGKGRYEQ